ncbi:putative low-specificity L-threonine aldolase 1 [Mactra antiquata]
MSSFLRQAVGRQTFHIQQLLKKINTVRCITHQCLVHSGNIKPVSQNTTASELKVVDLRSDTITKPGPGMRKAMAAAEVGDDVYGEDPTVNELQKRCAELFGKESALFVPTGTMGNLLSILVHCDERGSEAIVGHKSHILLNEQGGIAQFAGVNPRTITNNTDGTFDLKELCKLIRPVNDVHQPRTKLICLENSHNFCGGIALPMQFLKEVWSIAQENDLKVHTDGARILNSAVALDIPVSEIMKYSDSVNMCFSKGLAAPVGSVIAGDKEFIDNALRLRKPLGGGLRQAGILAAAALYSLDHIVPRLGIDNDRATSIANAVKDIGSRVIHVPEYGVGTNMVMLEMIKPGLTAAEFSKRLMQVTDEEEKELGMSIGVRSVPIFPNVTRIVTHNDLDVEMVDVATKKIVYVIKEYEE